MITIIFMRMVMHPTTIVVIDMRDDDKKCSREQSEQFNFSKDHSTKHQSYPDTK